MHDRRASPPGLPDTRSRQRFGAKADSLATQGIRFSCRRRARNCARLLVVQRCRTRGHVDRREQAASDSERVDERSGSRRRGAAGIEVLTQRARRGRQLIARHDDRVPPVRFRDPARIFSNEKGTVVGNAPAAVVPRRAWRSTWLSLPVAHGHRRPVGLAPHPAKECGFLTDGQQHHDRDGQSSKHGRLDTRSRKSRAIEASAKWLAIPPVPAGSLHRSREDPRIFTAGR